MCDFLECSLEIGEASPCDAALVMPRKEGIFSIQSQFPFILPMSDRFLVSITDGMPTSGRMSGYLSPVSAVMGNM